MLKRNVNDTNNSTVSETIRQCGINSLQFDLFTKKLYAAGRNNLVGVWKSEKYVGHMKGHTDWVNDIVLCKNGTLLVSGSADKSLKIWNTQTGALMFNVMDHNDYIKALAYAEQIEKVASGAFDKTIRLWDLNCFKTISRSKPRSIDCTILNGNLESVYALAMNPSGTVIISGSTSKELIQWNPRSGEIIHKPIKAHRDNIRSLVVSKDGGNLVSGSSDGTMKYWSLVAQRCLRTYKQHEDSVWALLATDDFKLVVSGGRDRRVLVTDLERGLYAEVSRVSAPVLRLCFGDAEEKTVWVATQHSSITCWHVPDIRDVEKGTNLLTCNAPILTIGEFGTDAGV